MSQLFTPFTLKDVTLRNRAVVPPMCQYSAVDGYTNDWHQVHYPGMARGGAGLVIVEATGVSPDGRITPGCTGLWEDGQIEGLAKIAASIKEAGSVPGIQIAHAGRKASANKPWEGDDHLPENDPNAWQPIAPSPIAFGENLPRVPQEMTIEDIERVKQAYVDAARRAVEAGFEWLELHFAHGYLAQSFFSPHSNQRTDDYGGSFDNRARFPLETLRAVREVWPENLPLTARMGVIEYDGRDEETVAESIELVKRFRESGLDFFNVSINFVIPDTEIPWSTPAFLGPIAGRVRREAGIPVASAWGMADSHDAERLIAEGNLDLVMIGRAHLANPHYVYQLAHELKVENPDWVLPAPYAHWLARYQGAGKPSAES
ncbi:MAG: NADH:flavin oxidoreductase/NADH oxidase [Verrucomicrobiales bacterium]|nr:NADH:flavin oxidoreductase/NADH oxidase [Verrucomicrobiales bacterium]